LYKPIRLSIGILSVLLEVIGPADIIASLVFHVHIILYLIAKKKSPVKNYSKAPAGFWTASRGRR